MSATIDELKQILGEMSDLEDGKEKDDILFTHDFCVKAAAELEYLEKVRIAAQEFQNAKENARDLSTICECEDTLEKALKELRSKPQDVWEVTETILVGGKYIQARYADQFPIYKIKKVKA